MPINSRAKGKRGELWLRKKLLPIYPEAQRRGWMQSDDGLEEPDVRAGPFDFEVKNQKNPQLWKALDQAHATAGKGQYPVVVAKARKLGERDLVAMDLGVFLEIVALLKLETRG